MMDRLVAVSAAGCVVFAAVLLLELRPNAAEPSSSMPASEGADARVPELHPRDGIGKPSVAFERPLFSATRRPPELKNPEGVGEANLRDLRLTGIIVDSDRRLAIFAVIGAESKYLVRSEGEMVEEWRLRTIVPREVSLSGPGGSITLVPKGDVGNRAPGRALQPEANPRALRAAGG
jgi:hypothetical protein